MSFLDIATPLIAMGIPITPVMPGTKRAFLPDFPTTATTDPTKIAEWNQLYSDYNAAAVARAEDGGVWFFETDSTDVAARVKNDTGHDLSEIVTFKVRSRPGRGHFYFRHNDRSRALGNISQGYVIGGDWSVRTNREYVVAAGSRHPDTGLPYTALNPGTPLSVAPDWLIDWLISQKIGKTGNAKTDAPRDAQGMVPKGSVHSYMLTQAGRLRAMGLESDAIEVALLQLVHANCEPPIDEERVVTMSKSICNFPAGESSGVKIPLGTGAVEEVTPTPFRSREYPLFPHWVLTGTSIYEGFVKPFCELNERIDYFMWAPAAAMLLNYVGNKVKVGMKSWKPSIYLALIGEKTHGHKSSSVKNGMQYMEYASVLQPYTKEMKSADGKTVVWEIGSPEGLGTDMQRTNCKNVFLFYDEFSALVAKAGIEKSSMKAMILKLYESASFGNNTKVKRDAFNIPADSYTASLIVCSTLEDFPSHWATFANDAKGMDVRFSFFLQPEVMPERKLENYVNYQDSALQTRLLIDRAVNQGTFHFFDQSPLAGMAKSQDTRAVIRAEKWALYFAIDLGLEQIDEDCVERGIAVAEYEVKVAKYLMMMEAKSKLAVLQQDIVRTLQQYSQDGTLPLRGRFGLSARVKAHTYDTMEWNRAVQGLIGNGQIRISGKGVASDPEVVHLLRGFDFEVDDEQL